MKKAFLLLNILVTFSIYSQEDKFQFNFDLTLGSVRYTYGVIENGGYSFSSAQWYDTVHSTSFKHEYYAYDGLNAMIHFGIHIPIVKLNSISFGLRPKIGIGRLIQISPRPSKVVDYNGYEIDDDPKRISSMSLDADLWAYVRYDMFPKHRVRAEITLLGGIRFLRSHDNYSTPTIGLEYSKDNWSIGPYMHFNRMNYYRTYSDGSSEIVKSFQEFGVKVNLFLGGKKDEIEGF